MLEGVNIDNEVLVTGLSWRVVKGSEYMKMKKKMVDVIFFGSTDGSHRISNEVCRNIFIACCSPFDITAVIEF